MSTRSSLKNASRLSLACPIGQEFSPYDPDLRTALPIVVAGELRLRPHQVGTNAPHALMAELLLDGGGVGLPTLDGAVVRTISHGGMVIRGDGSAVARWNEGPGAFVATNLVVLGNDSGGLAGCV